MRGKELGLLAPKEDIVPLDHCSTSHFNVCLFVAIFFCCACLFEQMTPISLAGLYLSVSESVFVFETAAGEKNYFVLK